MTDEESKLEELGLSVRRNGDCYICRTPRGNLLVVDFAKDEFFGDEMWWFEAWNNDTINCYSEFDDLLEALKNYLR